MFLKDLNQAILRGIENKSHTTSGNIVNNND